MRGGKGGGGLEVKKEGEERGRNPFKVFGNVDKGSAVRVRVILLGVFN